MSKKILLVEDEAILAMSTSKMIEKHEYEVVTAYKGEKAVEIVDIDPEISLILMDIDLGKGMDGTEAAEKILSQHEIPIVFLTSHSEKEYVDRAKKITNYGYVLKNSGEFVLLESIYMAYTLFEANRELKKENNTRRETEEELSSIYRHTPVLMLLVDKERRLRKANAFFTQFAGTPAEKMIGKRVGEALRCIHHLDAPEGCGFGPFCQECTVRSVINNTFADEKTYLRSEATIPFIQNGEMQQLTFLMSTSLFHKEEEDLCLVAFEDITDYKRLQNKYKELFENAPLPYQSLDKNGTFLEVNPAWLKTLGYTREEVIGKNFAEFLYFKSVEDFTHNLKNFKEKGSAIDNLYKMLKKNGDYIDVSYNGNVAYTSDGEFKQTHCIFKDITEESRMQAKLDESEKKYRTIVDNINDSLIIHNFEGVITFANDNTCRMLNYSRDELIGKSLIDLHNYAHRDFIKNIIQKNAWPDGEVHEIEALSKDGAAIPVEVSSKIVSREGTGEIQSVVRDISERKQAENAFREKTEMLNNTLEHISDLVVLADKDGNITYHSNVYDTLGYEQDSLIGRHVLEFVHPEDLSEVEYNFREFIHKKDERRRVEYRFRRAGGSYIWMETDGKTIKDEEGNIKRLLFSARDITERKKVEEELKDKKNLLQNITDNMTDLVSLTDKNGTFKFLSSSHNFLGYDADYLLGKNVFDFVHPEDINRIVASFTEVLHNSEILQRKEEYRYRSADGSYIWLETVGKKILKNTGEVKEIIFSSRDISKRKEAERENVERRQYVEAILNTTPGAIVTLDRDNRISEWNKGADDLFGYTKEEVLEKNIDELIACKDEEIYKEATTLTNKTQSGNTIPPTEDIRYTKEGNLKDVIIAASPIIIGNTFQGSVGAYTDITPQKQKEKQVQELLQEKEQLLKEVHHRIKNHMNTISAILSLRSSYSDDERVSEVLNEAQNKIRLMQNIYQTLYTGDQVSIIHIKAFLEQLLHDIQSTYFKTQSIQIETDIENIEVTSKQSLPIGVIVTELITNSIKYAFEEHDEGTISISIHKSDKDLLRIHVSDNGSGIPDDIIENEEYGFGLTLVDGYVQQFDGEMSIDNSNGTSIAVTMILEE